MEKARDVKIRKAIELMPKVELHVHFGGSIPLETIEKLARKNGVDIEPLKKRFEPTGSRYGSLVDFLDSYRLRCKCLQNSEDFEEACIDVLARLRAQGVRYAEITISPTAYRLNGLLMDEIMPGIEAGAKRVRAEGGMEARFIFDIGRQFGPEQAWQTAREAAHHQDRGVIGLGLGGDELHYSPEIFRAHFAFARKEGLHRVAHAGEAGGAESIWGALRSLGAERIGHGVAARGDEALLEHLRIHQVPVEMCPTSNLETGAIRSYSDHPLPEFLRRGLLVSLNTDDPAMFGTTLTEEYLICAEKLGLEWDEIKALCLNGIKASFLPDLDKKELLEKSEKELAEIESELGLG